MNKLEKAYQEYITKKKLYENANTLNNALKIIINSMYGAYGNQYFRYFNLNNAVAITTGGRLTVRGVDHYLEKKLKVKIIYQDTDSIFIHLESNPEIRKKLNGKSRKEQLKIIKDFLFNVVQPTIDEYFEKQKQAFNADINTIKMDYENLGEYILMKESKKTYAMKIVDEDGEEILDNPKYKIRGIEIVKSSTPKRIKSFLKDFIVEILNGANKDKLISMILSIRNEILTDCNNLNYKKDSWKKQLQLILEKYGSKRRVEKLNQFYVGLYNDYTKMSDEEILKNYKNSLNKYKSEIKKNNLPEMFCKIKNVKNITQHARAAMFYNLIVDYNNKFNFMKENTDYIFERNNIFYTFVKSNELQCLDVIGWKDFIPYSFFYKYKIKIDAENIFNVFIKSPVKSILYTLDIPDIFSAGNKIKKTLF